MERDLEGTNEQYYLISYKYPVARFGKKELEENTTITLYQNTNIIKMTVAEESIKAFPVPEEFLTFYYEISEEEMDFIALQLNEKLRHQNLPSVTEYDNEAIKALFEIFHTICGKSQENIYNFSATSVTLIITDKYSNILFYPNPFFL